MTAPFIADKDFTLYVGDVREMLKAIPSASVHCVVTSPPYWGLRDYQTGEWDGGDPTCDHVESTTNIHRNHSGDIRRKPQHNEDQTYTTITYQYRSECSKCGARRVDRQLGLESTVDEYVDNLVQIFREVRRVLRDDGTVWLNLGDSYAGGGGGNYGNGLNVKAHTSNPTSGKDKPRVPDGLKIKDLVGVPWRVAQALQAPYYTGKIRDERDRIWLAATIEAEGCMFIHRRKAGSDSGSKFTKKDGTEVSYKRTQDTFGAGLEVASTDRVIVERCMEITGVGSICEQSPETNPRRKQTIYRWNVRSNECRWIIREIYPHLFAKKHEARLLLGCPSSGDDARKAWASLKALHQGQSADIDFREPEGMWEEGWFLRSDIIWAKLFPTRCRSR